MSGKPTYEELEKRNRDLENRLHNVSSAKNQNHYRKILECSPSVAFSKDLKGRYTYTNKQFENLSGLKSEDVVGKTDYELFPHPVAENLTRNDKQVIQTGTPSEFEEYIPVDGKMYTFISTKFLLMDNGGKIYGIGGFSSDIIESANVAQELREKDKLFQTAIKHSPIAIVVSEGIDQIVIMVNDRFTDLFGYTKEDIPDVSAWWVLAYPDKAYREKIRAQWTKAVEKSFSGQSKVEPMEVTIACKDGTLKEVSVEAATVGEVNLVAFVDMTERKQIEEDLRKREYRYRKILQTAIDGFWITDINGNFLEVNPAYTKMSGFSQSELLTMKISDIEAHEEPKTIEEHIKKGIKVGHDHFESFHRKKDNSTYPVEVNFTFLKAEGGKFVVFIKDISERKEAEKKLLRNQYYLTKAQEIGKIGTWELDIQKNILTWTEESYKIFGVPLGTELTYELFLSCIHPEDREYVHRKWNKALKTKHYDIMHRVVAYNTVKWIREKAEIEFDAQGKPTMAVGFAQDLSGFKEIENALQESEKKFKTMFEKAPLSYQSLDENGNFTEVNQTWLQTMGYERDEVIGKNFSEFLVSDWKSHFSENFPRFKAVGEVLGVEFEMVKKDGSTILVSFHGKIGKNPDGSFKQTHCIFNDITRQRHFEKEKKILEQKMLQMQKLESIGNLAGGIAHDFNNLLFPIIGMSEMLLEDLPKDSPEYENAQEIFHAGRRAGELVNQILAFSRQSEHKMIPVHVQNVLKEVLKLSRSTIPANIEIKQKIQQDCGLVMADTTQIHQIAMNLITNAYHAVENENGIINIALEEVILDENGLRDKELVPGKYVKLSVSDNGIGMAQSTISKIFEPYFTTKEKGKGTGLGLSVVYGIVKEHKGDITVQSEVGKGTTFGIYLPLMEKKRAAVSSEKVSELETGKERILLVDDEISVAKLEGQVLSRLGYEVTVKTDSEDALNTFNSNSNSFDLVISDMTMPKMTGDKLAKKILAVRPEIPIIICTGFSERINKEQVEILSVKGFLMKPVVKSDMAQVVRKVLDAAKNA